MKPLLLASLTLFSANTFAQSVDLEELYSRYEQADYSSMELAEYNQTVTFQAIIVSSEENLSGGSLLEIAGTNAPERTLARITPTSANEAKFTKLKVGQKITAECQLEMTMGSDYMGFGECELK